MANPFLTYLYASTCHQVQIEDIERQKCVVETQQHTEFAKGVCAE